ncbi:MAG: UDP-N-acetylmuramoyl-tripeptide--D-alanyl-D-alanine ligase [Tissierellia bacterium]|nr:UDP-N-acetylmuramoyl-tripeptide--D-alanyl-D-alanine ligase [Tissierellia bacterium]
MINIKIEDLIKIIGGKPNFNIEGVSVVGAEIDSRRLKDNMLFVPIIGERVDGHNFFDKAMKKREIVSLWNNNHDKPADGLPVIFVEDTLKALQKLAGFYIRMVDPIVVAITGSNGKTSVKEILSTVLESKYRVFKPEGNFNTDIGLPVSLLNMNEDTEVAVLEMGIDHFGDMDLLSSIANPNIAIVTNIGEAHLDDLLTREGIAKAKLEFIPHMKANSVIIYNGDEPLIEKEMDKHPVYSKKVSYGLGSNNTYIPELLSLDKSLKFILVKPPVPNLEIKALGIHQMLNATAVIACATELDLPMDNIRDGLARAELPKNRTQLERHGEISFLNDTYKSNPAALRAGLDTLYGLGGYKTKIAILGDMLGIGSEALKYHEEIGSELDPEKLDYVFSMEGEYAKAFTDFAKEKFGDKALHFKNWEDLIGHLKTIDLKGSLIFLKASHSLEFDKLMEKIRESI